MKDILNQNPVYYYPELLVELFQNILIVILNTSNQKESTTLKLLIWETPSLSLGTYVLEIFIGPLERSFDFFCTVDFDLTLKSLKKKWSCQLLNFTRPWRKIVKISKNTKINHLSYVGDAVIGNNVNIGAGTITCNYDGKKKNKTKILDGAFIGSNTALVAPIKIGKKSIVGAGSALTKNVKNKSLALTRANQIEIKNYKRK